MRILTTAITNLWMIPIIISHLRRLDQLVYVLIYILNDLIVFIQYLADLSYDDQPSIYL